MRKEQIKERTLRIFTVSLEMGNTLGEMGKFLIYRVHKGEKTTTVLEEDFIVRITEMSRKINDLVNDNIKGKARIKDAHVICKSFNELKREFYDSYNRELSMESGIGFRDPKFVLNLLVKDEIYKSRTSKSEKV